MKAKKFVNSKLGDKNYTHSEFPMSRATLEEWLTEFAESEVKNLHIQSVKNWRFWDEPVNNRIIGFAVGLIIGGLLYACF